MSCRICAGSLGSEIYRPREMMFGTREAFDYVLCEDCSTLQIAEIPGDLAQYYAGNSYYSFNQSRGEAGWKVALKRMVAGGMIGRPNAYPSNGGLLDKIRRGAEPWTAHVAGLRRDSAVLDVGCGEGARLQAMARLGFTNLTGIDLFLPNDKAGKQADGIVLHSGDLAQHDGRYDCITMHHSLEHVPDPAALLAAARDRLNPGGAIYIRVPLFQPDIWAEFGVNWAQIDAPRHLYLFSAQAFLDMAQRAGLTCERSGNDTLGWSLAWSHAYANDIAMYDESGAQNSLPFTPEQIAAFDREAEALNAANKGDQGYFVLRTAE
ncbi:MAG: class I SAM-dependent methyltransferase [Erythrobacter sp.]